MVVVVVVVVLRVNTVRCIAGTHLCSHLPNGGGGGGGGAEG